MDLENVSAVTAYRTDGASMGRPGGTPATMTVPEAVYYLNANPRHALVLTDLNEVSGECRASGMIAVFRGVATAADNFYVQALPLQEPDADGGNWTAAEALGNALDELCA